MVQHALLIQQSALCGKCYETYVEDSNADTSRRSKYKKKQNLYWVYKKGKSEGFSIVLKYKPDFSTDKNGSGVGTLQKGKPQTDSAFKLAP